MREIFRLAEGLAAIQEGLYSFESVTKQLFHISTFYFRPDCHFKGWELFHTQLFITLWFQVYAAHMTEHVKIRVL
jgi:hypothetical protein